MATNARLPRRTVAQRVKDENAVGRHVRQASSVTNAARFATKENVIKTVAGRQALGEVTLATVNRLKNTETGKLVVGKEKEDTNLKRSRPNSTTLPQRVPLGPSKAQVLPSVVNPLNVRAPAGRVSRQSSASKPKRASRPPAVEQVVVSEVLEELVNEVQNEMDVEEDFSHRDQEIEDDESLILNEQEVESMVGIDEEEVEENVTEIVKAPSNIWPQFSAEQTMKHKAEVEAIRDAFRDEIDMYDTTMVSEYAEDIFQYMEELEEEVMPGADYMSTQNEITWQMRQTLVDWLLQVHLRYHMLPETLWIAVNIVDRFLTKRIVSLVKLQLVGVTAMFIAAKYEEVLAPSVDEFVFMTENGYSKEEILKGERIMLQTLDFRVSQYCSPYSWMRKISKADDYDIQTRTLSKFLTEVTLLDYRFLRAKPNLIAAVGMYAARKMLGGDWNKAFVFHSGYTEAQLIPGHELLVDKLTEENFAKQYVCKKYSSKKFLKASGFAIGWALESRGMMSPELLPQA